MVALVVAVRHLAVNREILKFKMKRKNIRTPTDWQIEHQKKLVSIILIYLHLMAQFTGQKALPTNFTLKQIEQLEDASNELLKCV